MSEHAQLSPSAAERWISCPASIRMESLVAEAEESPYAAEGTAAHALAELMARRQLLGLSSAAYTSRRANWRKTYGIDEDTEAEMEEHCQAYVDLLRQRLEETPASALLLEQRLDTGVPASWGTSDAVIISADHLEIVDFKYGKGVAVEAEGNPQLRLYALGALRTYGDLIDTTERVRITVHQPRLHHVLSEELTPDELRDWRDAVVLPAAELALSDDAPFGPNEVACRWCPASGQCVAQFEHVMTVDFGTPPELMDEAALAIALEQAEHVKIWLAELEVAALHRVYSLGRTIPGYKVVKSGGQRKVVDPDGAIAELKARGFSEEEILNVKIKGIGDLEKLVGTREFDTVLGRYVKKGEGRPSLAPEDDKRPSINPGSEAAKDFADVEEP